VREAYSRVFRAQKSASKAKDQRNARIVGYLLIYLHQFKHTLGETPISYLEGQIRRLENDEEVFELGEHYLQLFAACTSFYGTVASLIDISPLSIVRRYKATPNPSTRPSRDQKPQAELLESLAGYHARVRDLVRRCILAPFSAISSCALEI
jgi:hypothetical protein